MYLSKTHFTGFTFSLSLCTLTLLLSFVFGTSAEGHREKMMWILLPFIQASSVWGTVVLKMTQTFYQTEEDDDISIRWDTDNKTDLSLISMDCFSLSERPKGLFYMMNGVEVPESQHQQFAGRVQLDKDALRDGRVTLHLSRVTAEDSGSYRCDLAADYDQVKRRWTASEHFVLNVTQNKDGEDSDVTHTVVTEGADHPPGSGQQLPYQIVPLLLLVCAGVVTLLWTSWRCLKQPERKDQHGRYIEVLIEEDLFTM